MPYSKRLNAYPHEWLEVAESLVNGERDQIFIKMASPSAARQLMFKFHAFLRSVEWEAKRPSPDLDVGMQVRVEELAKHAGKVGAAVDGDRTRLFNKQRALSDKDKDIIAQMRKQLGHVSPGEPAKTVPTDGEAERLLQKILNK